MRSAIVTGTSSGIGLAITKVLLEEGYQVFGISRTIAKAKLRSERFVPIVCDITDSGKLTSVVDSILDKPSTLAVLVNNAGIGHVSPHEEIPVRKLDQMIRTNLLAPLLLTRLVLRTLKKNAGFVFNISSVSALKPSSFAAAYAASKAGLDHFSASLFEETRKSGVKVVTIRPDMTDTPFYDTLSIGVHEDPKGSLRPEAVAEAILQALRQPENTIVTDITLRPQKHLVSKKSNKH